MIKTTKVRVLRDFNNGSGVQVKGTIIDMPTEVVGNYVKNRRVSEDLENPKVAAKKVTSKKVVIPKTTKVKKSKKK